MYIYIYTHIYIYYIPYMAYTKDYIAGHGGAGRVAAAPGREEVIGLEVSLHMNVCIYMCTSTYVYIYRERDIVLYYIIVDDIVLCYIIPVGLKVRGLGGAAERGDRVGAAHGHLGAGGLFYVSYYYFH